MKRNKTIEEFFETEEKWQKELIKLREVLNSTGLEESLKWGIPAYSHKGKIVVGLGGFKSHFGLWFHQGALLEDKNNVLVNAQEGKTKAMRHWRMTSSKDIKVRAIKSYIKEAMKLVEEGKQIKPDRNKPVVMPPELKKAFAKNKKAAAEFKSLSKGKQREYADHISEAKRDETKQKRIEKILPMIANGAGLYDKYKNC